MLFSTIFTTIFLTANHLHSTFASPTASKGDVAAVQSLNLTHSLAKRATPPTDQQCRQPSDWIGRICLSEINDVEWADRCIGDDLILYWKNGRCPPNTICMNKLTRPDGFNIVCIDRPADASTSGSNQQTGYVQVNNGENDNPAQRIVSVTVDKDIPLASVSALIEGSDGNYVVKPNRAMVGSLRGTTAKTCSYNETNRDCVPTFRYDLIHGNTIDFTFGVGATQDVRFYYAIIGSPDGS